MQKFVVKKISRSTNITLGISEDTSIPYCDEPAQISEEDLGTTKTSVRMCGYLKKKRNRVGGWKRMYFVLQNSLFLSYNSKEEYEKKLVSFKDIICLIPNNTVLIPSLEPRFTIASNLNTFYTFRCDDNRVCSKWITAILECLSRELKSESSGSAGMVSARNFSSQQNINHHPKPIFTNHSWENLPNNNWIVNHNGRVLLELNYLNYSRAKPCIPIGLKTAQILQKYSVNSDVINEQTSKKPVNFMNDEKIIRNCDHEELNQAEHFRLHNRKIERNQSRPPSQINKMFESNSQRLENGNGNSDENVYSVAENEYSSGVEIQVKEMTLGDESGVDYSSADNYQSVDSKRFNNKLNIDTDYAEIGDKSFSLHDFQEPPMQNYAEVCKNKNQNIAYATVDLAKKKEERLKKRNAELIQNNLNPETIYEDIGDGKMVNEEKESNIYEMIDIPLRPSRKTRSLVFKNWSRIQLFGSLSKRFNTVDEPQSSLHPSTKSKKATLTLTDLSRHYRSMRNRAAKIYRNRNSGDSSEKNDNTAEN